MAQAHIKAMTERTKKVFKVLVWELLLLVWRLMILFLLFFLAAFISAAGLWDCSEAGHILSFVTWVLYFSFAFVLLVGLPFRKYVYLRCSKSGKRKMLLSFATFFSVAFFVFFIYPVKERRNILVDNKNYEMVTSDTIWNKLFQDTFSIPQSFFQKVRVKIYTKSGKRLGSYYVEGYYHYTEPDILIDDDGTPFTREGGKNVYFSELPRPKLEYSIYKDKGLWEWVHRTKITGQNRDDVLRYESLLSKDFELLFTMPDFQCATNLVALAALNRWSAHCLIHPSEKMVRYAEHVMNHPDIMTSLPSIWHVPGMDADLLNRGLVASVALAEKSPRPKTDIMRLLGYVMGTNARKQGEYLIPDSVLRQYADHSCDMVSSCALVELIHRDNQRKIARRMAEQHQEK